MISKNVVFAIAVVLVLALVIFVVKPEFKCGANIVSTTTIPVVSTTSPVETTSSIAVSSSTTMHFVTTSTSTTLERTPTPSTPTTPSVSTTLPDYGLPNEELCKFTSTGFSCILNDEGYFISDPKYEEVRPLEEKMVEACNALNGSWRCYGWCLSSYTHYCDLPFPDAGKECLNSGDCVGDCLADPGWVFDNYPDRHSFEDITCENCVGTCAEYALRMCDWWYELDDGMIKDHTRTMCD